MNIYLAWTLVIIFGIAILIMVVYGIMWCIANIQLHFIDKEIKYFTNTCTHIYICMNASQREFVDSNLKNIEIEITAENTIFDNMSDEERFKKIIELFKDLEFYFNMYMERVSKSCFFVKIIISDEVRDYVDIFDTFRKAVKIS